jgi:hypothetical protein
MCYNASFLVEHNEFYEGYGSDICLKDTGMQEGRIIEIRYNLFDPTSIGPGGGSGVQGHNQDAKVDRILIYDNVFLNKGTGVMFRKYTAHLPQGQSGDSAAPCRHFAVTARAAEAGDRLPQASMARMR